MRFSREGASVVIADIDADAAKAAAARLDGPARAVVGDVSRAADAERMVGEAVGAFGGLHILFNNAGVSSRGSVVEMTEEHWRRVFDINVTAVFLMSKYAIPRMKAAGGGVIVNTASALGIVVGPGGKAAYSASKAATIHLTRAMAVDHARDGIRVNCVCPGPTETPMFLRNAEELRARLAVGRPLGRLGTPDEIADAVLFLAGDESRYITGHALVVDGGGVVV